jgi:hypothetical protein
MGPENFENKVKRGTPHQVKSALKNLLHIKSRGEMGLQLYFKMTTPSPDSDLNPRVQKTKQSVSVYCNVFIFTLV